MSMNIQVNDSNSANAVNMLDSVLYNFEKVLKSFKCELVSVQHVGAHGADNMVFSNDIYQIEVIKDKKCSYKSLIPLALAVYVDDDKITLVSYGSELMNDKAYEIVNLVIAKLGSDLNFDDTVCPTEHDYKIENVF